MDWSCSQQSRSCHATLPLMNEEIQRLPVLQGGAAQPSAHLIPRATNCDSRTTQAISRMHTAFPLQRQPEKNHFVSILNRDHSFSSSRDMNIHGYCLHGGALLDSIPISEVKPKLLLNCRTPMDTLLLITFRSVHCLTLRDAFFSWVIHLFTPLCFWNVQNAYN